MKKKFEMRTVLLLCAFCVVLTAALCSLCFISKMGGARMFPEALKYISVRKLISDNYIGEIDAGELSDSVFRGMIASLEDRWSYYMSAGEYERYKQYSNNEYTGIGVTIQKDEETGGFSILSAGPDTPAGRAGIEAGQILTAVGGQDVTELTVIQVRALIQDCYGETVVLTMLLPDGSARDYSLVCETIYTDPVSYEMLEDSIGYVRIKNFESGSAQGFINAVEELQERGAASFVFDARNNPGGKVTQLMEILDFLLPEGEIFISRNVEGKESVHTSDEECLDVPMAVLINQDSYSAAEFFAAALREYEWAVTVGEQTTGKGRAQITFELPDGSAVHISHSVYLTPGRVDLAEIGGLAPDVPSELDDQSKVLLQSGKLAREDDSQLQAAMEAVKNQQEAPRYGSRQRLDTAG